VKALAHLLAVVVFMAIAVAMVSVPESKYVDASEHVVHMLKRLG
jgi:hypothetical protein